MRNGLVCMAALIAGGVGMSGAANALPFDAAGGMSTPASPAHTIQYYPPNVYRPYGYYPSVIPQQGVVVTAPPVAGYVPPPPVVVPAPAPATGAPPPSAGTVNQAPIADANGVLPGAVAVVPAPVIVVPPRPASCGEFRFWNGFACVDARFNQPYLGPRY